MYVVRFEQGFLLPEHLIETAKRRAAITGNESAGVEPGPPVAPVLLEEQAGEGLNAREEDDATFLLVALVECEVRSHDLGHGASP